VAAHARPRRELHEAVGLGRGGLDDLPDVDLHAVAEHRQLVDERDVDRAEDVLEQLGQLRRLGRRDADDLVADLAIQGNRAVQALRRQAADDLGCVAHRVVGAARVDALGREGDVEVAAGLEPGLLEQRYQALAGRARIGGRLERDELPLLEHPRERRAGVHQRAQVGLAVLGERRRHGDDHGLGLRQVGVARRGAHASADRAQAVGRDILDVAVPGVDGRDLARVRVEADHLVAGLGELHGKGEPDVAESDDPYLHGR
jgi:hypothetical protein